MKLFTLSAVTELQLGEYVVCIYRYNKSNPAEEQMAMTVSPDDMLCIQYFHLGESLWLTHLNTFVRWYNHYDIGDRIK